MQFTFLAALALGTAAVAIPTHSPPSAGDALNFADSLLLGSIAAVSAGVDCSVSFAFLKY
jgi:hypothetical protein